MHRTQSTRRSLRRSAEKKLAEAPVRKEPATNAEELLHELRVHQIQLEMQNENLRQAQLHLADSHDRYVELFDFSPVGYLTLTAEGTISQINPMCAELLGMPREKILKRRFKHFILPEFHERIDHLLADAIESDRRQSGELGLRRDDGSSFQVELVCRRMSPQQGSPVLHVALTDISERKLAEQKLRIAATAFESQEGMLVMDNEQVILQVNGAFTDITGYSPAEALGRKLSLLDAGRHDKAFYEAMWDAVQRGGFWQGEVWTRRKNAEIFPVWLTVSAVRTETGKISHYVGTMTDNTLRKAEEEKIKHLAFYDSLTQLPNRQLLLNRLQQALAASIRSGREGALLFIDLDNFKALNDTLGHSMGDLLLQQVAQRLNTCIREGDTVARLGGDEFVVMLEDLSPNLQEAADQIEAVGEKILTALNKIYDLDGHAYHSTPSIGATLFHGHRESVAELLKSADLAMYHAKAAGRNVLRFFDPEMQAAVTARINLESELKEGLQKGQFVPHYQAQVDADGRLVGVEALLRWQHPRRNLLAPSEFIALAEDTGLIVPIGQWLLETVCRQLVTWSGMKEMAHLTVSINVSARELRHPDFVGKVLSTLEHYGTDSRKLCLELSENILGRDLDDLATTMTALKSAGVRFSLDNFGSGTSSLSCIKRLPLDQLKLSASIVRNVDDDSRDTALASSIAVLGKGLGVAVVANSVETERQRQTLLRLGFGTFQGFLFSRPCPVEALREMASH